MTIGRKIFNSTLCTVHLHRRSEDKTCRVQCHRHHPPLSLEWQSEIPLTCESCSFLYDTDNPSPPHLSEMSSKSERCLSSINSLTPKYTLPFCIYSFNFYTHHHPQISLFPSSNFSWFKKELNLLTKLIIVRVI